jgi:hypothetical protein
MTSLESYWILFSAYSRNQKNCTGDHAKHTGHFFQIVAYSRMRRFRHNECACIISGHYLYLLLVPSICTTKMKKCICRKIIKISTLYTSSQWQLSMHWFEKMCPKALFYPQSPNHGKESEVMNLVHDQREMCDLHMGTGQWFWVIC